MFSQACVILFMEVGVHPGYTPWMYPPPGCTNSQIHHPRMHPLDAPLSLQRMHPRGCTAFWMYSPFQWMHPPKVDSPLPRQKTDGIQGVGTHPTGMHTC